MNTLSIQDLIKYIEGTLPSTKSECIKQYIKKYPYYLDMIEGIKEIQDELANNDKTLEYFEQKQEEAWSNIFTTTSH